MSHSLYRHRDSEGDLLYVGISLNAIVRLAQHKRLSSWSALITRIDIEYFETEKESRDAERKAIKKEKPKYNGAFTQRKPEVIFTEIINDLRAAGWKNYEIAAEIECSAVYIGQLVNGHRQSPTYDLGRRLIELHQNEVDSG